MYFEDDVEDGLSECNFCNDKETLNMHLHLRVLPCGHTICDACHETAFRPVNVKVLACKRCVGLGGEQCNFRRDESIPLYGPDPQVQKELRERHRVLSVYLRLQDDFTGAGVSDKDASEAYNNHLAFVEEVVYKLVHRAEDPEAAEAARREMEEYESTNLTTIKRTQARRKERDTSFGIAPLPWQTLPEPSLHYVAPPVAPPADEASHGDTSGGGRGVPTPGARPRAPHAPGVPPPATARPPMQPQAPAAPVAVENKPEAGEAASGSDAKLAKRAGGYSDRFQKQRDSQAAVAGLRAALARFGPSQDAA